MMTDEMVVVVAVTDEDTCWDLVSVTRSEVVSHRPTVSSTGKATFMKSVAARSITDQLNGFVDAELTRECDPDACANECSCGRECLINGVVNYNKAEKPRMKAVHIQTEGLFFAVFLRELQRSLIYRLLVLQHWTSISKSKHIKTNSTDNTRKTTIQVKLHDTLPHVLDYTWGERMCRCALERQHLDTMMSWLSTLGGACSALGDHLSGFAERAWAISVQQLEIAQRLGDPNMVSRCRLYAAISLIQQCKFKVAARIIKQEYQWSHTSPPEVRDTRLIKMCLGIWTKLRHEKKIYCLKHNCPSTRTI